MRTVPQWLSCSAVTSLTFTPDGTVQNKAQFVKSVAAAPPPPKIEFLPDTTVRIHGSVAFVAGKTDFWDARTVKHLHVLHVWEKTPQGLGKWCRAKPQG